MAPPIKDPKACTRCGVLRPRGEFYRIGHLPNAIVSQCKACSRDLASEQRAKAGEAGVRRKREYNKEWLLKKHGLTWTLYEEMLVDQGGKCAICRIDTPTGKHGSLHIDHCHTTLKVRGLLCHNCNSGLGHFRDSVDALKRAIAYLETSRQP